MRIHAIQTGTVQVHERQRAGSGTGVFRFLRTLADQRWTEPLPIYAWVVEHLEGLIVVDTGETARTMQPGYFPSWHPYYRFGVRMDVRPEEEVGPRLQKLGLSPADVRWVVLTHLHTDHAGGVHHFPKSEILVSRAEFQVARGLLGKLRGYLPHRWPAWFSPRLVDFRPEAVGPFPGSYTLTRAGDVRLVPTSGHSGGHLSVVVQDGEQTLFLAGDTSYTQQTLLDEVMDGVCSVGGGEAAALGAIRRIKQLARQVPLVYLPSHDPSSAARLAERQVVFATDSRGEVAGRR